MKLFLMAALYYWGNKFIYLADKILYEEADLKNMKYNAGFVNGNRTKRINKAIETHMRIEDFFGLK